MENYTKDYSERMKKFIYLLGQDGLAYKYSGINEGLISDKTRNIFYNNILKECKGKNCIDVGSGSGLLAFMAIQNGAKHVTCIEQNIDSCNHIKTVAKKMGISSKKITVINDEFQASRFKEYNIKNPEIIFHELVGSHIWNDTIGNAFNCHIPNVKILPEKYQLYFTICPLTEQECKNLIDYHRGFVKTNVKLDPGIDLPYEYIQYYTKVVNEQKYEFLNPVHMRVLDKNTFHRFYSKSTLYRKFTIDINDPKTYKMKGFGFELPQYKQPYLLFIHPSLHSGEYVLDFYGTHFTGLQQPILVPAGNELFKYENFVYNIFDGDMKIDDFYV